MQFMRIHVCAGGLTAFLGLAGVAGCSRHTVDVQPIRVEPIHMTVDINIRVDRELDEFFDYEDEEPVIVIPPAQPATQPAAPTTMPEAQGNPGGVSQ